MNLLVNRALVPVAVKQCFFYAASATKAQFYTQFKVQN